MVIAIARKIVNGSASCCSMIFEIEKSLMSLDYLLSFIS